MCSCFGRGRHRKSLSSRSPSQIIPDEDSQAPTPTNILCHSDGPVHIGSSEDPNWKQHLLVKLEKQQEAKCVEQPLNNSESRDRISDSFARSGFEAYNGTRGHIGTNPTDNRSWQSNLIKSAPKEKDEEPPPKDNLVCHICGLLVPYQNMQKHSYWCLQNLSTTTAVASEFTKERQAQLLQLRRDVCSSIALLSQQNNVQNPDSSSMAPFKEAPPPSLKYQFIELTFFVDALLEARTFRQLLTLKGLFGAFLITCSEQDREMEAKRRVQSYHAPPQKKAADLSRLDSSSFGKAMGGPRVPSFFMSPYNGNQQNGAGAVNVKKLSFFFKDTCQYVHKILNEQLECIGAATKLTVSIRDSLVRRIQFKNPVMNSSHSGSRSIHSNSNSPSLSRSISDFVLLKPIAKGGFGEVYLGKKKSTNEVYAIKVMKCSIVKAKKDARRILQEKDVMESVGLSTQFIVALLHAFRDGHNLFFAMEFMPGGDLRCLLNNLNRLQEHFARFYMAETVLALESLHMAGIIHRDIKPDNILISATGHVKLADFGLSEVGMVRKLEIRYRQALRRRRQWESQNGPAGSPCGGHPRYNYTTDPGPGETTPLSVTGGKKKLPPISFSVPTSPHGVDKMMDQSDVEGANKMDTTEPIDDAHQAAMPAPKAIGTPDYVAPEIVCGGHATEMVDVWSLCVTLFELITGFPPFHDDELKSVLENILALHIPWPDVPNDMSYEAFDLLNKGFQIQWDKRITLNSIKEHPWFEGFDWRNFHQQEPPFVPKLEDECDTRYFPDVDPNEFELHCQLAPKTQPTSPGTPTAASDFESAHETLLERTQDLFPNTDVFDALADESNQDLFSDFTFENLQMLHEANLVAAEEAQGEQ